MKKITYLLTFCGVVLLCYCERPCKNIPSTYHCSQLTKEYISWIQLSPNSTLDSLMELGHTSCYIDNEDYTLGGLDTFYYVLNNNDTFVASSSWGFTLEVEHGECYGDHYDHASFSILFPDEIDTIVKYVRGNLNSNYGVSRVSIWPSSFYLIDLGGTINTDYIVDTFQVADTIYTNVYKYEDINYHFESVYFKPRYGYLYFKTKNGDELKLVKKN